MITYEVALGNRPEQQDRLMWATVPEGTLLGVFDGHGGAEVADLLDERLPIFWSMMGGLSYAQSVIRLFEAAAQLTAAYSAGSTASVAFIPHDEQSAYIAVIGDSPVIAEKGDGEIFIGPDHNARSNPEERSQAIARGGIYQGGYLWSDYGDNAQGLQMTRALGDYDCRNFLSREPEVFQITLGNFLLIGSDGLMDSTHAKGAAPVQQLIADLRAGKTAAQLVQQALSVPINDNVTALLWRRNEQAQKD